MIALAILLLLAGFVLVWTGFAGDDEGGHNPISLIGGALGKKAA